MTQEDKQLLLKDLCARLPYGVMVSVQGGEFDSYKYPYQLTAVSKFGLDSFCKVYNSIYTPLGAPNVEDVKPYLRSMSSMTEEERKELKNVTCPNGTGYFHEQYLVCPVNHFGEQISFDFMSEIIDWLNEHHLDFRGLIEKGLALEAKEGMYKF